MRVVVIGGGPAGVSAALHAAELGAEVTLIERRRVGGTALNSGPAPVRTLARAARLVRDWSSWETFGLRGPRPEVDLAATLANAQRVVGLPLQTQASCRPHPLCRCRSRRRSGRRPVRRRRHCRRGRRLRTWTADRVIIAVGGRPGRLADPGRGTRPDLRGRPHGDPPLPGRVCVIGAADTGCQLTSILADFGCDVTLVEYAPRIVPRADIDVSVALADPPSACRGIEVVTGANRASTRGSYFRCAR